MGFCVFDCFSEAIARMSRKAAKQRRLSAKNRLERLVKQLANSPKNVRSNPPYSSFCLTPTSSG